MTTPLGDQLRQMADKGAKNADELREAADAVDTAAAGFYATPQTVDLADLRVAHERAIALAPSA